jgi:hypothetical protein
MMALVDTKVSVHEERCGHYKASVTWSEAPPLADRREAADNRRWSPTHRWREQGNGTQ